MKDKIIYSSEISGKILHIKAYDKLSELQDKTQFSIWNGSVSEIDSFSRFSIRYMKIDGACCDPRTGQQYDKKTQELVLNARMLLVFDYEAVQK